MNKRAIGFGNILDEEAQALEEIWTPTCSTVIECEKCETKLYYHDVADKEEVISTACKCESIRIVPVTASMARYNHFVGIKPRDTRPKIYEIPYEEYLKIKQ